MFRRKRSADESAPSAPPAQAEMPPSAPTTGANGYVVTELPTYHAGKRKVVVYTSDPQGRIIKRFKR